MAGETQDSPANVRFNPKQADRWITEQSGGRTIGRQRRSQLYVPFGHLSKLHAEVYAEVLMSCLGLVKYGTVL